MQNIKAVKGYWHLQGLEDNRIAGILHYIPNEKIYLELIGAFEPPLDVLEAFAGESNKTTDLVLGEDQNGKKITLIKCRRSGSVNFSSSFAMNNYSVEYMLYGIHLDSVEDEKFHSATIKLPFLTEWVNQYMMRYSILYNIENDVSGFEVSYDIKNHKEISVPIKNGTSIRLSYSCSPPETLHNEKLKITQHYELGIKQGADKGFSSYKEIAERFKTFLSLACLTDIDFIGIDLFNENYSQDRKNGKKIFFPISLYWIQPNKLPQKDVAFNDFLFHYTDIEQEFENIITTWFSFNTEILPILNHLINSIRTKRTFGSGDFLLVVQAIEGFHIRFRKEDKKVLF